MAGNYHGPDDDNYYYCPNNNCPCHDYDCSCHDHYVGSHPFFPADDDDNRPVNDYNSGRKSVHYDVKQFDDDK